MRIINYEYVMDANADDDDVEYDNLLVLYNYWFIYDIQLRNIHFLSCYITLVEVKFGILKNKVGLIKYFYLFIASVLIHGHEMVTLFLHIPNVSVYFFVLYIFHMPISVWP